MICISSEMRRGFVLKRERRCILCDISSPSLLLYKAPSRLLTDNRHRLKAQRRRHIFYFVTKIWKYKWTRTQSAVVAFSLLTNKYSQECNLPLAEMFLSYAIKELATIFDPNVCGAVFWMGVLRLRLCCDGICPCKKGLAVVPSQLTLMQASYTCNEDSSGICISSYMLNIVFVYLCICALQFLFFSVFS